MLHYYIERERGKVMKEMFQSGEVPVDPRLPLPLLLHVYITKVCPGPRGRRRHKGNTTIRKEGGGPTKEGRTRRTEKESEGRHEHRRQSLGHCDSQGDKVK